MESKQTSLTAMRHMLGRLVLSSTISLKRTGTGRECRKSSSHSIPAECYKPAEAAFFPSRIAPMSAIFSGQDFKIKPHDGRQQDGVNHAVQRIEHPAQGMGQGMFDPEPGIAEGHRGGSACDAQLFEALQA